MHTHHQILIEDARCLTQVDDASVHLIVTSPPYPMIPMWDDVFSQMSPAVSSALEDHDGPTAFEAMHNELDKVWTTCHRVLIDGGIIAVNIGDATRTLNQHFRLYPNHARIISTMTALGMTVLPDILWRKPTNSPTKFMGSGMLPPGAYVTYEHEYILLFRKGNKRPFRTTDDKIRRRQSAYFWEERNHWFSDIWSDLPGTHQALSKDIRARSAAYPFTLPHRLINMFSVYQDTVLDPFVGTGTTMLAAAVNARNSIGVDILPSLGPRIADTLSSAEDLASQVIRSRLADHANFVTDVQESSRSLAHINATLNTKVMTRQETQMQLWCPINPNWTTPHHLKLQHQPINIEQ